MPPKKSKRTLTRLKADLKKAGITQRQVAKVAGTSLPLVSNVLAGRTVSANIVNTAERLLAGLPPKRTFTIGELKALAVSLDGDPRAAAAILEPHGITVIELNQWATAKRLNDLARERMERSDG